MSTARRPQWARTCGTLATLALGLLEVPTMARAQSAIIYGQLSNFDIANDTGQVCHGFEVELEGVTAAQVPSSFSAQRELLRPSACPAE